MSAVITDQQSGPKVAEFFSPGPGERLRAARLSMGFDIGKIASELHLPSATVERLEADDYEGIGARVFVRGYLRNYARIVEMPADSLLHQFDEKWPDDTIQQSMLRESPRLPADGGPSRGWAGVITWVLVIGLVALFLMWWQGYLGGLAPEAIQTTEAGEVISPDEAVSTVPASSESGSITDELLPATEGGLRLPTLGTETRPSSGEPVVATAEPVSPLPVVLPTLATGGGTGTETVVAADETSVNTAPTSPGSDAIGGSASSRGEAPAGRLTDSPTADGGAPVVEATTGIVMTFSAPCWVDVRDSSRKFKLFGEMPKGARKVLGGNPPYKVVIGNARAVDIEVNGQPFDISRFARGNVARFTLDP